MQGEAVAALVAIGPPPPKRRDGGTVGRMKTRAPRRASSDEARSPREERRTTLSTQLTWAPACCSTGRYRPLRSQRRSPCQARRALRCVGDVQRAGLGWPLICPTLGRLPAGDIGPPEPATRGMTGSSRGRERSPAGLGFALHSPPLRHFSECRQIEPPVPILLSRWTASCFLRSKRKGDDHDRSGNRSER